MSKTYTIPIGPVHPALKEVNSFIFKMEGERVLDVDLDIGYQHRGIEWIVMNGRNPIQALYLSERICGICSTSHPFAYVQSVEDAAGITPPERAEYIRALIGELERVHSHILWAGVAGHEIGFDTLLHISWDVRENVMDLLEAISGNRVNYAMYTIGGVRRDLDKDMIKKVRKSMKFYKEQAERLIALFLEDRTVKIRTEGVGILTRKQAELYVGVGPTARASGVPKDVRQDYPYSMYGDMDIKAILPSDYMGREIAGDVYDRIVVRILEVLQSVEIIEFICDWLEEHPGPITYQPMLAVVLNQLKMAKGEGIGRHEAPRGEVFHYCKLNGEEYPQAWKVKAPTYNNYATWPPMLKGCTIADIPIVLASIDPCLGCADRYVLIDEDSGKKNVLTLEEMRDISRKKTRDIQRRGNK